MPFRRAQSPNHLFSSARELFIAMSERHKISLRWEHSCTIPHRPRRILLFVIIIGTIPRYKISSSPVTTFDEPVKIISNIYTSGDWRLANRQNIQSKYKSQKLLDGLMSGSDEVPHTQRINFWLSKMDMSPVDPINTAGELWVGKTAQSNCYPSGDQTIILNHVCCIKMKFVFWREWTDVLPIK